VVAVRAVAGAMLGPAPPTHAPRAACIERRSQMRGCSAVSAERRTRTRASAEVGATAPSAHAPARRWVQPRPAHTRQRGEVPSFGFAQKAGRAEGQKGSGGRSREWAGLLCGLHPPWAEMPTHLEQRSPSHPQVFRPSALPVPFPSGRASPQVQRSSLRNEGISQRQRGARRCSVGHCHASRTARPTATFARRL
jgi:hypothetical protein